MTVGAGGVGWAAVFSCSAAAAAVAISCMSENNSGASSREVALLAADDVAGVKLSFLETLPRDDVPN